MRALAADSPAPNYGAAYFLALPHQGDRRCEINRADSARKQRSPSRSRLHSRLRLGKSEKRAVITRRQKVLMENSPHEPIFYPSIS
ncbi:hypothetical protein B7486_15365 [cyanobacterium TDX16]|nr:hypothetical protein B7486_15365 [cyanobacterium TDX16]